jgi:hypothetical protein
MKKLVSCLFLMACCQLYADTTFTVDNISYTVQEDDARYVKVVGCTKSLKEVVIPETVQYSYMTRTVNEIGTKAFYNSPSVTTSSELYKFTSITLPSTITKIASNSFYGCSSLTQVNIPESVKTIGNGAFYKCTALTSVKIPNSVTRMEGNAFNSCTSLTTVNIPDSITIIGGNIFKNCPIESIEIPNGVESIGGSAFYGTKIKTIVIPESVNYIYSFCFYNCKSLETVIFGTKEYSQQITMEQSLFAGDSALTDIYCYNTTVPTMNNENVFDADTYNTACLHVPASVTAAYQKADYWKNWLRRKSPWAEPNRMVDI